MHNGLDLAAATGTPVYAAAAGKVSRVWTAGEGKGKVNGNALVLAHAHPSVSATAYLHLSNRSVRLGEVVQAGQLIGHVGSSGQATGPHLHLIAYQGSQTIDPAPLLRPPRARRVLEAAPVGGVSASWWVVAGTIGAGLLLVGGVAVARHRRAVARRSPPAAMRTFG